MSAEPDETHHDDQAPFRSAEDWLRARGVEREPIRVSAPPADRSDGQPDGRAPVSAREAARLANEPPPAPPGEAPPARADEPDRTDDTDDGPDTEAGSLGDRVASALAFIRRSTAGTPQSEARLRAKLTEKGELPVVIDHALQRARDEQLVDDDAMAAALVAEWRAKGHAPLRIRQDLRQRGFPPDLVARLLVDAESEDQEAAAFDVARRKAAAMRNVEAETAYRRLVGHLARRGYPEGLARKVARQVVYVDREHEQIAGR